MLRLVRLTSTLDKLPKVAEAENGQVWAEIPYTAT